MTRRIVASLVCTILLLISDNDVSACSCAGGIPVCEAAWMADAVFVGQVVGIEALEPLRQREVPIPDQPRVAIRVVEVFRGAESGLTDI